MNLKKRFAFSCISVVCITVTTILLKYPPEFFLKLVGLISGLYITGQSTTDMKKIIKGEK